MRLHTIIGLYQLEGNHAQDARMSWLLLEHPSGFMGRSLHDKYRKGDYAL